jgi:hypothetical protein
MYSEKNAAKSFVENFDFETNIRFDIDIYKKV